MEIRNIERIYKDRFDVLFFELFYRSRHAGMSHFYRGAITYIFTRICTSYSYLSELNWICIPLYSYHFISLSSIFPITLSFLFNSLPFNLFFSSSIHSSASRRQRETSFRGIDVPNYYYESTVPPTTSNYIPRN